MTSSVLEWQDLRLRPGKPVTERARWSTDGLTLIEPPRVGDLVSLHWDWVCEVISPDQAETVRRFEESQRDAVGLSAVG